MVNFIDIISRDKLIELISRSETSHPDQINLSVFIYFFRKIHDTTYVSDSNIAGKETSPPDSPKKHPRTGDKKRPDGHPSRRCLRQKSAVESAT